MHSSVCMAKLGDKNPLKQDNKNKYNSHSYPHKGKQEPSLDCLMSTLSHPHTWISPVAHFKSHSRVSNIDIPTLKIQHLPLLKSPQILIWTPSKIRHCNSFYNQTWDVAHILTLTELKLPLQHDLQTSPVLLTMSKSESMQLNSPNLNLPTTSSPSYVLSVVNSQGWHLTQCVSIIPKIVIKESSHNLQIFISKLDLHSSKFDFLFFLFLNLIFIYPILVLIIIQFSYLIFIHPRLVLHDLVSNLLHVQLCLQIVTLINSFNLQLALS